MEDMLNHIIKECNKTKHGAILKACQEALDLIEDKSVASAAQPHQLRARCLNALQLALDSRNSRLTSLAIGGMQIILKEERFQSCMESEQEIHWLSMQMLHAVRNTAALPEDVQVEVMRLLLNMTMTLSQCMNAPVIICIAKLCFESIVTASRATLRSFIVNTFLRMLHLFSSKLDTGASLSGVDEVMVESYSLNGQCSVRTAVKATFTQLLSTLTDKVVESDMEMNRLKGSAVAEFSIKGTMADTESLSNDVVAILQYLCDRLSAMPSTGGHGNHGEPLLLEGILTVVCRLPESVSQNQLFRDLVWQKLCPSLISILANPMADKTVVMPQRLTSIGDEVGRGSGCSSTAPNIIGGSAKTIYSISVNLVRALGRYASLRPVLESLFHRMLLYPPAIHRHDAIKSIRPLLSTSSGLLLLAGPTISEPNPKQTGLNSSAKRKQENELRLLKIVVDSIQECCHCNDSAVVIASVELINQLLISVEDIVKGRGISDEQAQAIKALYKDPEDCFLREPPASPSDKASVDHVDSSDDSDVEVEKSNGQVGVADSVEHTCANHFVEQLVKFIPILCSSSDVQKADQMLQEFASKFCADVLSIEKPEGHGIILNADAIYVTTYAVLHLCYNLCSCDYYDSTEQSLPISEFQFIDEIMETGLLLILSRGWLSAIFHLIISRDIFRPVSNESSSHQGPSSSIPEVIVTLLTDIDGLNSKKVGGQLLSEFQKSAETAADVLSGLSSNDGNREPVAEQTVEAGMMFARKILSACWDGILDVLSVLTSGKSSCGISGSLALLFNAKEESRKAREAICVSLEGLQRAAQLSSILGLQNRCGAVFAQLAAASCVLELDDIKRERHQHQQRQLPERKPVLATVLAAATGGTSAAKPKLARLHAAHALSMDIILSIGLELGSHTADCWQHIFRCCAHISELEHTYFSQGNDKLTTLLPRRQTKDVTPVDPAVDDDLENGELYSTLAVSVEPVTTTINVRELIHQSSVESGWDSTIVGGGVLSASQSSKVLCGLSQEIDRLYENAADKLNMKSLVNFLAELCRCSHQQLATFGRLGSSSDVAPIATNALLLFRLGDIMSRCVQSERPLLHIVRTWNVVSQHLIEAACHRDRTISQKAIACIHEIVTTLLSSRTELPHFHFNETLCKPFENLLCLEMCDGDTQDQIVCSLCELVEACTSNIKSGWKPIFGALRAVKIQYTTIEEVNEARLRHVAAVLDVFNVFLGTDNVLVFANAAVDCILCLLKYVRGQGEFEDRDDSDSDYSDDTSSYGENQDLCLPALQYLKQCADFLASMWLMPNCPIFVGANRIHTGHCRPIEPFISNIDIAEFQKAFVDQVSADKNLRASADDVKSEENIDGILSNDEIQRNTENQQQNSLSESVNDAAKDCQLEADETRNQNVQETASVDETENQAVAVSQGTDGDEKNCENGSHVPSLETVDQGNEHQTTDEELALRDSEQTEAIDDSLEKETPNLETRIIEEETQALLQNDEEAASKSEIAGNICKDEVSVSNEEDFVHSGAAAATVNCEAREMSTSQIAAVELLKSVTQSIDDLDNSSGVLHVFFLIFEGLASAVSSCPKNYQPQTLEMLFQLMRSAANIPGPRFALYVVNMLLLPTLQSWLRRGMSVTGYWDSVTVANCKHYTGLCVDLVVEYIINFTNQSELQSDVHLLLHQQLLVLVEFITEPVESLSRIGCSCIRHCLLHCGPVLSEDLWEIAGSALQLAFDVTLFPLRQLMTPFHENSDNFYGDVGQVKVAIRLDSSPPECERLRQISQQVFLLDSQRSSANQCSKFTNEDQKSFIFLIYRPESASDSVEAIRIPFRNLVIGLLSHQLLVQTVGTLLLRGTSNVVPAEFGMMASSASDARSRENSIIPIADRSQDLMRESPLPDINRWYFKSISKRPGHSRNQRVRNGKTELWKICQFKLGMLPYLSCQNLFHFLDCLSNSFQVAFQFDSRPGLKFLIQKVLRADVAANLYKQAGVSMTVYAHVLLEISARHQNLCAKNVIKVLEERIAPLNNDESKDLQTFDSNGIPSTLVTRHQQVTHSLRSSTDHVQSNTARFICLLRDMFDDACAQYIDLYLEREGPSIADRLSQSLLVFLLAEPEELPSLKREKSLKELVTEKLRKQSSSVQSDVETEAHLRESRHSLSLDQSNILTPHRHRGTVEDRVYTVATDRTIKSLMAEYRKRKQVQSMPRQVPKSKQSSDDGIKSAEDQNGKSRDEVEKQIEEQQKSSIMKDGEAHLRSHVEMLCSILTLLHQLPDNQFHALQPIFFHSIAQLTANCKDSQLRQMLGQWTLRIGRLFEILGPE